MEQSGVTAAPRRVGRPKQRGYPALDGIRAVAVLAVMLYHFGVSGVSGGFLGVDVFFVLSGYLITGQLVTRWVIGGQVSIRSFWVARARRLLPALGALLVGTTTAVVLFDRSQLALFRGDVTAAATYSSNWWYVLHQRSYFASTGRPPVLLHLWSLAVEEQFYAVWPLVVASVVALCVRVETRLRVLLASAVVIGMANSLVMGVGSALTGAPESADPSRWYFGSDSHVMGLMAGAAVALVRRGDGLGAKDAPTPTAARPAWTAAGLAALALLLVALSQTDEFSGWLYRWGFLSVSLLTCVVIAVATRPGPVATILDRPVLRALGRRSYALYLWHWPIACFTRPGLDLPISNTGAFLLRLGLTFLLAEVSYQWVEQPVRRLGWRPAWRVVAGARVGSLRAPTIIAVCVAALGAGVILPASASPAEPHYASGGTVYVSRPGVPGSVHIQGSGVPTGQSHSPAGTDRVGTSPAGHTPTGTSPPPTGPPTQPPTGTLPPTSTPRSTDTPRQRRPAPPTTGALRRYALVVYGDSVPLGAIPDLAATFHSVSNDAVEGAQAWTLLPELTAAGRSHDLVGDVVLIHVGDNGVISPDQLNAALTALTGAARVILAVPYVPRSWQDDNRAVVESIAGHYRNVVLMDWGTAARAHPDYLWSDGVHLTPTGEVAYSRLVAAAAVRH